MKLTNKTEDAKVIDEVYNALEKQLLDIFAKERADVEKVFIIRYADMRYYGQEHVIKVPVMAGEIEVKQVKEIEDAFINAHEKEYGFVLEGNPVEIVNFHTTGILRVKKPTLYELSDEGRTIDKALKEEREVYFGRTEGRQRIPIYSRNLLPTNVEVAGPAIIEETTSTTIVTKDFKAKTDKYGNFLISKNNLTC